MTDFEKARDEAGLKHGENWCDSPTQEMIDALSHAHNKGADWAREWCENHQDDLQDKVDLMQGCVEDLEIYKKNNKELAQKLLKLTEFHKDKIKQLQAKADKLAEALSKVEQAIQDSSGFDRHLYVENNEIRVDFDSFATATVEDCSAGYITLREIQEALKEYRGEE